MDSIEEKTGKYITANDVKVDLNKLDEDHLARIQDIELKVNRYVGQVGKIPEVERSVDMCKRQLNSLGLKISKSDNNMKQFQHRCEENNGSQLFVANGV